MAARVLPIRAARNSGTLVGSDSVVSMNGGSYPASPVGTGVYFNGLSGTGNYVSVPYNAAMSGTTERPDA